MSSESRRACGNGARMRSMSVPVAIEVGETAAGRSIGRPANAAKTRSRGCIGRDGHCDPVMSLYSPI